MERSTPSISRRLSLESTTTSEFEVISADRSSRGSTVRGSDSDDPPIEHRPQSPSDSFNVPSLYSVCGHSDHESILDDPNVKTILKLSNDFISTSNFELPMSGSCLSDTSMIDNENTGMLEQLEKTAQGDDDWRVKIEQLMERNRMLEKSLITSKSQEAQQAQEIDELRQQNTELSRQMKTLQEHSAKSSSASWYHRLVVLGLIAAVLALYIACYDQLLNERRNNDGLKEILQQMNDVVEKLEMKHKAEYKQLLEETSKQIADDMNVDISMARKERELEHERLIEAYREKMLLYKDLDELRKEKFHGKRRSSFKFF